MADILTQDEVDALLNAVSSGDVPTTQKQDIVNASPNLRDAVSYDFKRPEMVSKDQMRTIQMVHENFARYLSNFLSAYLRTVVDANILAVDQLTFGEFVMSLPNPTNMNIIDLEPLEGRGVFEVNPVLVFAIVDRLLGGAGATMEEIRVFTDIEQSVIGNVVGKALQGLSEAWASVAEINFSSNEREMNPQFCQILAANETVISVTLEVTFKDVTGIISICIPFIALEPIVDKLSARHVYGVGQKELDERQKSNLKETLNIVSVKVSFEVGRTTLRIKELLDLQPNDIVVLDKSVKSPCAMCVENSPKFEGTPGLVSKKKGFKILNKI